MIVQTQEPGRPPSETQFEARLQSALDLVGQEIAAGAAHACVTCSFQAEDVVLLHMLRPRHPQIPVVFLDTGYHFAETCEYRDRLARDWGLNLINVLPAQSVAEQEAQFGILHRSDPSRCCGLRKVTPLFAELEKYGLWFTGLRREQARSRAELKPVDGFTLPGGKTLRKISPLTDWSAREVWRYAKLFDIPLLSLYDRGYTSIGCEPCTSLPLDPDDPRSGRWGGKKQECGIHIQST